MKKQTKTAGSKFEFKPSTLQILSALMSEHQWLDLLTDRYGDHRRLIQHIHELSIAKSYDKLSIKNISKHTGQTSAVTTRVLHKLYEDLYTLNEEQPELFRKPGIRYELRFIGGFDSYYVYFTLWLDHPLQHGDTFTWPFLGARLQAYDFYVYGVKHDYGGGQHLIHVDLREGTFNLYRKMLYDQACMRDLIGIHERYRLTDHELERLLIHRVVEDRDGYPESLSYLKPRKYKW